jgi:tRNA threonylcarbamoyladenosine modification (KEOPS) complex  Pcc1 subunit
MEVKNILEAINMADYDGIKRIEISVNDLQTLRHEIINLYSKAEVQRKDLARLRTELNKMFKVKNISLEAYNKKGEWI